MLHRQVGVLANRAISAGFRISREPFAEIRSPTCISRAWGPPSRRCRACEIASNRASAVAGELSVVSGMAGRYATALFELALEEQRDRRGQGRSRPFRRADRRECRSAPAGAQPGIHRRRAGARARGRARQGRHRRRSPAVSQGGGVEPPAVRRARHDQGVPQARRPAQGRGDAPRSRSPRRRASSISPRSRTRSRRSPRRTCRST